MRFASIIIASALLVVSIARGQELLRQPADLCTSLMSSRYFEELKLTPKQIADVRLAMKPMQSAIASQMEFARSGGNRSGKSAISLEKTMTEVDRKLEKILTKAQVKRLDEIKLQGFGVDGLRSKEYAERLNLSPVTSTQIKDVLEARNKRIDELSALRLKVNRPNELSAGERVRRCREIDEKMAEVRRTSEIEAYRQLSKKQRAHFRAMRGEPYDFKKKDEPMASAAPDPAVNTATPETAEKK